MLLAAVNDDAYKVFLYLHIVAFLLTFAPVLMNPMLEAHFKKNGGDPVLRTWSDFTVNYTRMITLGGLGVLFVTGIILILLSDDAWEFSDAWISLSFLLWFAIGGVVSAMILKGEKQVAGGDMSGGLLIRRGGQIATLLLALTLYLMIFKPGA